jgi:hypothetical protein
LVKAFDSDGGDYLALSEVGEGCGAIGGDREVGWVGLLEAGEEINLSECELDS